MTLFPVVGRKQPFARAAWGSLQGVLWLGVGLHLFPIMVMFAMSLKPAIESTAFPPTLLPQNPTFEAWQNLELPLRFLQNSLVQCLATLALSLPVTSMAAYAVSKLTGQRSSRMLFVYFVGTLMVPLIVTLIPAFLLTRSFPFPLPNPPLIPGTETPFPHLRIWNTHLAVIVPGVFNAFSFLLFKGYFDTIPSSVLQAARVDGASEINIFRRIVLPMSVPVYAAAAWLQFSTLWDAYLWPLCVLQSSDNWPLSLWIGQTQTGYAQGGAWNYLMVLGIAQIVPVFLAFIVAQRYLMKGIRLRGLR